MIILGMRLRDKDNLRNEAERQKDNFHWCCELIDKKDNYLRYEAERHKR